jgi:molybdopterin/thiamine biosynthesis adenylyltransferase
LADWLADEHPLDLPDEAVSSLCCIEPVAEHNASVHLLFVYGDKVGIGNVDTIAPEPRLSARVDGLAPSEALQRKRIALVGVGSGGSMAAVNLAAAGVGTLHLFDKDVLSGDNVFRHACDLRHVGRAKVLAVKDQIASHDLPSKVIAHDQDVVKDAGDLWATMAEVDLVLCATDNILSRRLVNYVAVRSGVPLVMACAFENASIGEIIRVRPEESACYECTRLELSKAGVLQLLPDAEESGSHVPYGREPEIGEEAHATNQGSRADVAMVSALQSRVAISTLLTGEVEPLPTDYLTWGGRIVKDLSGPFNFERPFSTNWVHLERQDACPVCGDIGRPVDKESDRAYEEIMASLQGTSA